MNGDLRAHKESEEEKKKEEENNRERKGEEEETGSERRDFVFASRLYVVNTKLQTSHLGTSCLFCHKSFFLLSFIKSL